MKRKKKSTAESFRDLSIEPIVRWAPVWLFVVLSLLVGFTFMQTYGTFTGPDMPTHYRATLAAVTNQSLTEPLREGYVKHSYIAGDSEYFKSGYGCINNLTISDALAIWPHNDGMERCIEGHDAAIDPEGMATIPVLLQYPPSSYLPQIAGLSIGRNMDAKPLDAQKYARWANLISYIVIIAIAISIIPRGRWLFMALGLLPTSVFLASSVSADALMIAWSFLFVAMVMRMYVQRSKAQWWQIVLLAVLGVGFFALKTAYAPLLLLVLILPQSVVSPLIKYLLVIVTVIVGALLYIHWSSNWGSMNAIFDTAQNAAIIKDNFIKTIVGIAINILLVPMLIFRPETSLYLACSLAIFAIIALSFTRGSVRPVKTVAEVLSTYKLPIVGVVIFALSVGMTFGALLLTWNDVASTGFVNIGGFQGRYVLPLLPLLVLLIFVPQSTKKRRRNA